jgi:hypothetical protein
LCWTPGKRNDSMRTIYNCVYYKQLKSIKIFM